MYNKTIWEDRVVDPVSGAVVQVGTRFTAARANSFESGIEKAHQLIENLAQTTVGSAIVSGLAFTASGLAANYTAGTAYVNGVRVDVPAGSITLNPTQGQYIYLDSDGAIKKTASQSTAEAKCVLWYFATDASAAITSTDKRNVLASTSYVKQSEVATSGANKILKTRADGKADVSITGDAASVGGKTVNDLVTMNVMENVVRDLRINLVALAIESETIKGANLNGITANIFVETFKDLNDITQLNGATKHDSVNMKVYLA